MSSRPASWRFLKSAFVCPSRENRMYSVGKVVLLAGLSSCAIFGYGLLALLMKRSISIRLV